MLCSAAKRIAKVCSPAFRRAVNPACDDSTAARAALSPSSPRDKRVENCSLCLCRFYV